MLINTNLAKLNLKELTFLLEENGYNSEDIDGCEFEHVSNGNVAYKILFTDLETGNRMDGRVYVSINGDGKLVADY